MSDTDSKATSEGEVNNQHGIISKLILLGILPLLYTIGLGMVILHFSGVNFHTQVKWIENHTKPLLVKIKAVEKETVRDKEKKAVASSGPLKTNRSAANTSNPAPNSEGITSNVKNEAANTAENIPNPSASENSPSTNSGADQSTETSAVTDSLASMDPKAAAKLLSNMPESDAVRNLKLLEKDVQTAIISELPAEEGARLALALEEGASEDSTTNSAIQLYQHMTPDQIAAILKGISDRSEVLKQIKQLDPKTASKVVSLLDPQVAGWIVSQMN